VASEEQIQQWADEAEAGYDVEKLKRRGRGRPGLGAVPMQVVAVRLTAEELDALDEAACRNHMSRELGLGFGTHARLLETVVLVFDTGEELVIHAVPARRKLFDLLP
jgi:hypothetical protein